MSKKPPARSFDRFFDQWFYHGGHPKLSVDYSWDQRTKLAKISVSQTQKANDNQVGVFKFPVNLRFKGKFGTVDHRVDITEKEQDFYVPLQQAPDTVRFDPEFSVFADVQFNLPSAMLYAQLNDSSDVVGRLIAVDQLGSKIDQNSIDALRDVLNKDRFYGVRIHAANSLRSIHTDEALEALIASHAQNDARVRCDVVTQLGKFYNVRAREALLSILKSEKNPAIKAAALEGLGAYQDQEVHDLLVQSLNTPTYRNILADGAIKAIRKLDDSTYADAFRPNLASPQAAQYTSRGFSDALNALAYICRGEKDRDKVFKFIASHLNDKNEQHQNAAIRALGDLEDARAIPLLTTFARSSRKSSQQAGASMAIMQVDAARRPRDNLSDLRNEVLELQKTVREQKKELDALKKRLDIPTTPTADAQAEHKQDKKDKQTKQVMKDAKQPTTRPGKKR